MGTGEHDNQLERYWSTIHSKYPRLSHRFGVLLSPRGITASHPEYKDFAYREVGTVLEQAASAASTALDPDARIVVRHYVELLRSEFMENAEAAAVAWKIWMEHRSVIEFVRRNAPSAQLCAELKRLVDLTPLCEHEKTKGREEPYELAFVLRGWRVHPHIGDPGGKSGYKSSLLFWFDDFRDHIKLSLGVWERRAELLGRLSNLGSSEAVFRGHRLERQEDWVIIWSREFASSLDLKGKTKDQIFQRIRERWARFCQNELAAISTAVLKHVPNQLGKRPVTSLTNR